MGNANSQHDFGPCSICRQRTAIYAAIPCGHLIGCSVCIQVIGKTIIRQFCPECKLEVTKFNKISRCFRNKGGQQLAIPSISETREKTLAARSPMDAIEEAAANGQYQCLWIYPRDPDTEDYMYFPYWLAKKLQKAGYKVESKNYCTQCHEFTISCNKSNKCKTTKNWVTALIIQWN